MIDYQVENQMAVLRWNLTSQPMNVISSESIAAFEESLKRAYADPAVRGIVVTSARREFVAGADLKQILRTSTESAAEVGSTFASDLQRVHRQMETNGKPLVAAINGTALGGGLEIGLACHHRIALDAPGTQIGLPEVTIGLLPGAGGTQRLPRLIGLERALPLLLEGRRTTPREAHEVGIVQELVDTAEDLLPAAFRWLEANPQACQPWDEREPGTGRVVARPGVARPGVARPDSTPADEELLNVAEKRILYQTQGNYPAPLEILACLREGLALDIDAALAVESRHFVTLASGAVARNLIRTSFFGTNAVNKGAARPAVPAVPIRRVYLTGADPLATELIQAVRERNLDVVSSTQDADLALEALTDPNEPGTSDPSVVRLYARTPFAAQAVVEVIRRAETAETDLAKAFDLVRVLRKTPLVVGGSYLSRCVAAYADEGQRMWDEGIDPDRIQVAGLAAGMPAGPLPELASAQSDSEGITPDAQLMQRLLYRQALEAQRCVEEGLIDPLQADVGAVLGWGFPAYTGGPISFIETQGRRAFVAHCQVLADSLGERFRPTPGLLTPVETT